MLKYADSHAPTASKVIGRVKQVEAHMANYIDEKETGVDAKGKPGVN